MEAVRMVLSFNAPSKSVRSFEGNGINTYHWEPHRIPQGEKKWKKKTCRQMTQQIMLKGYEPTWVCAFKKSRHHPHETPMISAR